MGNNAKALWAKGVHRSTGTFDGFTVPLRLFQHENETVSQCSLRSQCSAMRMLGSLVANLATDLGMPMVPPKQTFPRLPLARRTCHGRY